MGHENHCLEESANFATLDTEKLFSKLKSHELFRKGRPNLDASLTSKAFVTSTYVGGESASRPSCGFSRIDDQQLDI
jgi:hypothetical protein